MEKKYAARNYSPLPVVFSKASGIYAWDPEGKRYMDFLSAYSAVNQGHCHPKIIEALVEQSKRVTLSSRAFYNDMFPRFSKYVQEYFGFDMVLPMNTGAEGVETAIKLARKWAYMKKGVTDDKAIIVAASDCFHGRTLGVISLSDDPEARDGFGPFLPNLRKAQFNDIASLEAIFKKEGTKIAGFLVEPIQGEAGVVVPDPGYLKACKDLCEEHDVLFMADEVQTGLCRTGKMLAIDWDDVRPDIVILGKAISGGAYPLSCVLADKDIMLCIGPGQHGSTYGGNPVACAVGIAALEVLKNENLAENAMVRGEEFRAFGEQLMEKCSFVKGVRGKGLLNAFIIDEADDKAYKLCNAMKDNGILAKPTHENIIRFAPPLVITKEELEEGMNIIEDTFKSLA
eukprot:CAMPEP_0117061560 /NCGR_PEP_ID=MMETSP0472-20121206/42848_1 /TAXON_ID=693140 ORGANISM="Tiarina fusus, Strain LIS" /NCGR_SAMPLE_ID=MMETSP0472 /ASSEMBLY_ACC=CAM_ASM_000603 /LENGTH=398 /DNA_ID=CAMNT_0004780267 /DNA_START=171 /DNA_END=1367 /DNA_ORIENTATION=+